MDGRAQGEGESARMAVMGEVWRRMMIVAAVVDDVVRGRRRGWMVDVEEAKNGSSVLCVLARAGVESPSVFHRRR
ncbi:hypothetical protein ANO11243_082250 [Dothideomycetidae sp. 11243]|nr:hypothetical protein ANO11243_082250 [fungal sp. No.11243]